MSKSVGRKDLESAVRTEKSMKCTTSLSLALLAQLGRRYLNLSSRIRKMPERIVPVIRLLSMCRTRPIHIIEIGLAPAYFIEESQPLIRTLAVTYRPAIP
jgi:hypothetical protein